MMTTAEWLLASKQAIFYNCSFFQQLLLRPPSDGLPTTTRIILGLLIRSFILHTSIIYLFISEQILPLVESGDVNSISCFIQQEQDGGDVTRAFLSSWSEYAGWILVERANHALNQTALHRKISPRSKHNDFKMQWKPRHPRNTHLMD